MKRLALLVPLALLLALPSPAAAAQRRCAQPGSDGVERGAKVRVYERNDVLVGCLRATGRRRVLARRADDGYVTSGDWAHVDVDGRFVAWSYRHVDSSCKADCPPGYDGESTWVGAIELRSGSRRTVAYDGTLTALQVSATGGLAYVLDRRDLWLADGGGTRMVDSSEIEPGSLRMRGSTLHWRGSGGGHTATVDGGTTCEPRYGVTRAWDDVVRAYDRGPERALFACAWLRARPIRLTRAPHDHVEAAGRFVAWSEPGTVAVRDVLRGREVRPAAGTVLDVALGGDGAVAWLESDGRLLATRGTVGEELAAGAIEPGSLVVRGGIVRWRQDGVERSAAVPG